jgi:hypothetical protein
MARAESRIKSVVPQIRLFRSRRFPLLFQMTAWETSVLLGPDFSDDHTGVVNGVGGAVGRTVEQAEIVNFSISSTGPRADCLFRCQRSPRSCRRR